MRPILRDAAARCDVCGADFANAAEPLTGTNHRLNRRVTDDESASAAVCPGDWRTAGPFDAVRNGRWQPPPPFVSVTDGRRRPFLSVGNGRWTTFQTLQKQLPSRKAARAGVQTPRSFLNTSLSHEIPHNLTHSGDRRSKSCQSPSRFNPIPIAVFCRVRNSI